MMIAETPLRPELPRARRVSSRTATPSSPRGFVFAVAALPGEAEGFRWPSWLSPVAGSWNPHLSVRSSSKRNR
jgi:hypothetical protein